MKVENDIEVLKAIWYTRLDRDGNESESGENPIQIKGFEWDKAEELLMVEYKKINELGLEQLQKFVILLENYVQEVIPKQIYRCNPHTLNYFKTMIRRGPFAKEAEELIQKSTWIRDFSDNMGINGMPNYTMQNVTVFNDTGNSLGASWYISTKLPKFMSDVLKKSTKLTETMFNDNITMASSSDDTKPLVDKKNQSRYGDEPSGQQVFKPHGNYMVKDRFFYLKVEAAKVPIKEIVKGYLKEQRDTVLTKIKRYNPFIDEKEQSYDLMKTKAPTPKDNKITEKVKEVKNLDEDRNNEQTEEITLNIMLDVLETTNKRKNQLQIEDKERNKSVNPNTSKGQLGNGD